MENSSVRHDEDYEDEYIFSDPKLQAVLIFLYSIVFFFCFFGNLIVVLVMSLHWKMRGSTKFCLGNLAFANLCVGSFCIYQDLSMYLIDSWVFGEFLCKMYHFINNLAHTASILILVVIAIERYVAILHPFRCRRIFTTRRLRLVILGVWILSALLCSPRLYYIKTVTNPLPPRKGEPMRYEVICTLHLNIYDSSTAVLIQFVLLFLLPLLITSILYARVGIFLRQRETFVCSFVQASALAEADSSGERILQRDNSTRSSIFENLNRKVSFKEGAFREKILGKKTDSIRHCVHVRGSSRSNSISSSTCPTCAAAASNPKNSTNANNMKSLSDNNSILEEPLKRLESTSSGSSSSVLVHGAQNQSQRNTSPGIPSLQNPHKGVVRLLVTILVTFTVCNFPFHLRKLYQNYFPQESSESVWSELATPLSFLLMYANCAINPILYAFMSRSFRSSVMDCLRCQIKKPSHSC